MSKDGSKQQWSAQISSFFVHNLKDIQFADTEEEQKPENIHI